MSDQFTRKCSYRESPLMLRWIMSEGENDFSRSRRALARRLLHSSPWLKGVPCED